MALLFKPFNLITLFNITFREIDLSHQFAQKPFAFLLFSCKYKAQLFLYSKTSKIFLGCAARTI